MESSADHYEEPRIVAPLLVRNMGLDRLAAPAELPPVEKGS